MIQAAKIALASKNRKRASHVSSSGNEFFNLNGSSTTQEITQEESEGKKHLKNMGNVLFQYFQGKGKYAAQTNTFLNSHSSAPKAPPTEEILHPVTQTRHTQNSNDFTEQTCRKSLKRLSTIHQKRKKTLRERFNIKDFVILPSDKFKSIWNIVILICLAFSTFVIPFRISFYEEDSLQWEIVSIIVDCLFGFDIVINMFSAFYDSDDNLITNRKKILKKYFSGWFFIDFISILPLAYILESNKSYTSLARLMRLPRLYRLIKLTKLLRGIKLSDYYGKTAESLERIYFIFFLFFIIVHLVGCFWALVAKLDGGTQTWIYRYGFQECSIPELYIHSLYWSIISITVGFGDPTSTAPEKGFQIFVTLIGFTSMSMIIGSLSSILYSIDSKQEELKEKIGILDQIRRDTPELDDDLYMRIRKALKYNYAVQDNKDELLKDLPNKLKNDLLFVLHKETVRKFPFFKSKSKSFIVHLSQLLKPIRILKGGYLFEEGEVADNVYFLIKGEVSLVLRDSEENPFLIFSAGQYFGEYELPNLDRRRLFTAKATCEVEVLAISITDLLGLPENFKAEMNHLFNNIERKVEIMKKLKKDAEEKVQNETEVIAEVYDRRKMSIMPGMEPIKVKKKSKEEQIDTIKNLANKLLAELNNLPTINGRQCKCGDNTIQVSPPSSSVSSSEHASNVEELKRNSFKCVLSSIESIENSSEYSKQSLSELNYVKETSIYDPNKSDLPLIANLPEENSIKTGNIPKMNNDDEW